MTPCNWPAALCSMQLQAAAIKASHTDLHLLTDWHCCVWVGLTVLQQGQMEEWITWQCSTAAWLMPSLV